jgi:hypothetical protein
MKTVYFVAQKKFDGLEAFDRRFKFVDKSIFETWAEVTKQYFNLAKSNPYEIMDYKIYRLEYEVF